MAWNILTFATNTYTVTNTPHTHTHPYTPKHPTHILLIITNYHIKCWKWRRVIVTYFNRNSNKVVQGLNLQGAIQMQVLFFKIHDADTKRISSPKLNTQMNTAHRVHVNETVVEYPILYLLSACLFTFELSDGFSDIKKVLTVFFFFQFCKLQQDANVL